MSPLTESPAESNKNPFESSHTITRWGRVQRGSSFYCIKSAREIDYVIGNPPYQDETLGENATYAPQVYHLFMDAAYEVANKVELIHPARFLFDAGSTPKAWNARMLNDSHFKVLHYEPDAKKLFPGVEIPGGIAVTYRDEDYNYGAIEVFTSYSEMNSMLHKVISHKTFSSMEPIVITRTIAFMTISALFLVIMIIHQMNSFFLINSMRMN